jgi:hypothetical protein
MVSAVSGRKLRKNQKVSVLIQVPAKGRKRAGKWQGEKPGKNAGKRETQPRLLRSAPERRNRLEPLTKRGLSP